MDDYLCSRLILYNSVAHPSHFAPAEYDLLYIFYESFCFYRCYDFCDFWISHRRSRETNDRYGTYLFGMATNYVCHLRSGFGTALSWSLGFGSAGLRDGFQQILFLFWETISVAIWGLYSSRKCQINVKHADPSAVCEQASRAVSASVMNLHSTPPAYSEQNAVGSRHQHHGQLDPRQEADNASSPF